MKRTILTGGFSLCLASLFAQGELLNLRIEARADYMREYVDGTDVDANSGFKGKFLNIRMDGRINDEFSYSYRQRLNKQNGQQSFFDATDWVYLTYSKNNWELSAGKQVVGIGGYEYDRAPIDVYFASEYWANIPCYQMGASVAYKIGNNDKFMLQVCQSPFRANSEEDMYAYNLMWNGSRGFFNTIYSVNMLEYLPGKYINYITLGNRFVIGDFALELDVMNRATSGQVFIGKDMTVVGELQWKPSKRLSLFGKVSYDVNRTDTSGDLCVRPGTEITRVGAGLEFFPMKNGSKDVRLHANACYTFGDNGNSAASLLDKQTIVDLGVTWRMNLLSLGTIVGMVKNQLKQTVK